MEEGGGDSCDRKMGCNGERCMWSATRDGCKGWCRFHSKEWANCVIKAIKASSDRESPALLVVDRLNISGEHGLFLRGDGENLKRLISEKPDDVCESEIANVMREYVSMYGIKKMSLSVTACGLVGNPPDDVVCMWESQHTALDELEFSRWRGYGKRSISVLNTDDGRFLYRNASGEYACVGESEAALHIASIMGDKELKGTKLVFTFNVHTGGWDLDDVKRVCGAMDVKGPGGALLIRSVSGAMGRTFTYKPGGTSVEGGEEDSPCAATTSTMLGGVHVSLDCGNFVAQWHTSVNMEAMFSTSNGGGGAMFRAVMLW